MVAQDVSEYDTIVYGISKSYNTSLPPQEKIFIWPPFFNITNGFCGKRWVGHACICPRSQNAGPWLASFEIIPPLKNKVVFSAQKKYIFYMDAHPHLKQISDKKGLFFFFG